MKLVCRVALFLLFSNTINAQLWTGSVGDPLANITFGFGGNPGPALPAGQSGFTFSGSSCPTPGQYSLVNLSFACFGNAWHTLSGDVTPNDAGGYYMLVNATQSANVDFIVQKVSGLCPGTRYQFAAFIKNALRPSSCNAEGVRPNLTFTIEKPDGAIIASYSTGEILASPDPAWNQYGTTFVNTENQTEVVLRIKNTAASGCGNALAIDDVTLAPCGPLASAIIINNNDVEFSVCEDNKQPQQLQLSLAAGFSNAQIQWQLLHDGLVWKDIPGANGTIYSRPPSAAGSFTYRALVYNGNSPVFKNCPVASNRLFINVLRAPFVQATNYVYGCLGSDVVLQASGANKYVWTGPNGFSAVVENPVLAKVSYRDSGLYKVTGVTNLGCVNSDSTFLQVFPNAVATSGQSGFICEGGSLQLSASGGFRYQWQPAAGLSSDTARQPVASPLQNTVYTVKVTNVFGCTDTARVAVNIWRKPIANAGPDRKMRLGFPITLLGSVEGTDVKFRWTPTNTFAPGVQAQQLTPLVNPVVNTTYRLAVESPYGCGTSTDEVQVKVFERVLIPNAFSPNGDGINDTWVIEPLELFDDATTEVYNRFGQLVYRARGYTRPWDGTRNGTPLPAGTYYYIINLKINNQPLMTGSLTIIK